MLPPYPRPYMSVLSGHDHESDDGSDEDDEDERLSTPEICRDPGVDGTADEAFGHDGEDYDRLVVAARTVPPYTAPYSELQAWVLHAHANVQVSTHHHLYHPDTHLLQNVPAPHGRLCRQSVSRIEILILSWKHLRPPPGESPCFAEWPVRHGTNIYHLEMSDAFKRLADRVQCLEPPDFPGSRWRLWTYEGYPPYSSRDLVSDSEDSEDD